MDLKHEAKGSMKRYRKTQRGGGLFSAIEHEQAVAAKSTGILKSRDLILWESFRAQLEELTGYAMRDWTTTPAHGHDSQVFEELLDDKDQAVLADSAYQSEEHEAHLIALNAQEFLMRKATRGHPLSQAEPKTHHTISRMRVGVEHIFARMAQMRADLCRSIGLKRATQPSRLSNLVYNMDRYACIAR